MQGTPLAAAAPAPARAPLGAFRALGRNVVALGVVSLLTDVGSEMYAPVLPLFITGVLQAPRWMVGLADALPDFVGSLLKLVSGWLADRTGRRKLITFAGYTLSSLAKPLLGFAGTGWHVLAVRIGDRVGKGLRTSPRDALLADSCPAHLRGWAFGFHRGMDHLGAAIGPLLGLALLSLLGADRIRSLFFFAAVPGALTLLVLGLCVHDPGRAPRPVELPRLTLAPFDRRFKLLLGILFVFALGNSTDFYLLLRAGECGVGPRQLFVLWSVFHVVKSLAAGALGHLSDRVGRAPLILAGWCVYAISYLGFALAGSVAAIWACFLVYALFYGFTEGNERALVADLAPSHLRGTAFGLYNCAVGFAALPANLLVGFLWQACGPAVALGCGAALAGLAALLLAAVRWKGTA